MHHAPQTNHGQHCPWHFRRRHQQHHQPRPLEQDCAQIAQGVERAKNVDKNFMNHQESAGHADRRAHPVQVKEQGIAVPEIGGKHHNKGNDLGQDVTKKELELTEQFPAKHEPGNRQLQDGMQDPERVVKNLESFAHASRFAALPRILRAASHDLSPARFLASRQCRPNRCTAKLDLLNPVFNGLR